MTVRGILILAAILIALAGYLRVTRPPSGPVEDSSPLLAPSLRGATAIELSQGARTARMVREHRLWNESRADDLLADLASTKVLTVIDPAPADSAVYGFGPDAVRLRVLANTAVLASIEVGSMNPAATGVYVRRFGEPSVLLVGALLHWELEKLRRVISETVPP